MNIISRAGWNARPPKERDVLPWTKIDTIFVHYTAAFIDESGDPRARMRGIQNYHMDTKGWNDIAYNFAFARTGEALEGRGWAIHSAATGKENDHSVAFVFLGADKVGRDDVTAKGRTTLGDLIRQAGQFKRGLMVKGHTEAPGVAGATACPGKELLAYVHLKGWEHDENVKFQYPAKFFQWAAWYLGEGDYADFGPRSKGRRPNVPVHLKPIYWVALRRFLRARAK